MRRRVGKGLLGNSVYTKDVTQINFPIENAKIETENFYTVGIRTEIRYTTFNTRSDKLGRKNFGRRCLPAGPLSKWASSELDASSRFGVLINTAVSLSLSLSRKEPRRIRVLLPPISPHRTFHVYVRRTAEGAPIGSDYERNFNSKSERLKTVKGRGRSSGSDNDEL